MSAPHGKSDHQVLRSGSQYGFSNALRRGQGAGPRRDKNRSRTLPGLEQLEDRMMLSSYSVTSNGDSATTVGTLRYAITQLDANGGSSNTITFNLPSSELTIQPFSPLPAITKPVEIEGNTEPGFSNAPLVEITGTLAGYGGNGLTLSAGSSGSVVQGLVIASFENDGVDIQSSDARVIGCYIGTNNTGVIAAGNEVGILVGAASATIGGMSAGAGNVISGNGDFGVDIEAPCVVEGNLIGTNATGTGALGNDNSGINVGVSGATIGGSTAGAGNVISGSGNSGILISASCLVEGNLIGTNQSGSGALANDVGIFVYASGTTIGGASASAGNVIAGNSAYGVFVEAPCLVEVI